MAPEEHHEEAEAHQQHGQDVDGPGVGDGVKNGLGGTVQTAFVNGGDGAEPLCHVAVDRGEEGHSHGHRDQQEHDEQAGLAFGLHGLYTSLLVKYHKGPGLIPVPCVKFTVAPFIFSVNCFPSKFSEAGRIPVIRPEPPGHSGRWPWRRGHSGRPRCWRHSPR